MMISLLAALPIAWGPSLPALIKTVPAEAPSGSRSRFTGAAAPSAEGPDEIARALELRNASGALWREGRYAEAAGSLRAALEIYESINEADRDPKGFLVERAKTLRAIVWNDLRAGSRGTGLDAFESLVALRKLDPKGAQPVETELRSAHAAVYEHAAAQKTAPEMESVWERTLGIYKDAGDKRGLHQVMHDRAGMYGSLGDAARERRELAAVIKLRLSNKDHDGANWSRNNLAYCHIQSGDHAAALEFLSAALADMRKGRGVVVQAAAGYNLLELSKGIAEGGRPDRKVVGNLWGLAEAEARSSSPAIVPPERLLAAAMDAEVARVGAARATGGALGLLKRIPGVPASVGADLRLHAAEVLIAAGEGSDARGILDATVLEETAVRPYLHVRKLIALAEASAALEDGSAYDAAAAAAIEALDSLDHDGTSREGLPRLAEAGRAFPNSEPAAAASEAAAKILRTGKTGGAGGSALGGELGQGVEDLAFDDPLFSIRMKDGTITITDQLSGAQQPLQPKWFVRTVSYNGMALELFGGYVSVRGVDYGNGKPAKGSKSGLSLGDLDAYRPVVEDRPLFVTKNGATFYGKPEKGGSSKRRKKSK